MRHGSLFSGIGGFDLAAEWMGWENVFHCEWEEFPRQILKYYWPNAISYGDIKQTDFAIHRGQIDILTGGFPCQPFSVAGHKNGSEDDRELSQEFVRAAEESRPTWIVGENVGNILNEKFKNEINLFYSSLVNIGYEPPLVFDFTADSIGLPTMERHIWFITKTNQIRPQGGFNKEIFKQPLLQGEFSREYQREYDRWQLPESRVCELGERVSRRLDTKSISANKWHQESLKGFGNAIPPKMAYEIFKTIEQYEFLKRDYDT